MKPIERERLDIDAVREYIRTDGDTEALEHEGGLVGIADRMLGKIDELVDRVNELGQEKEGG